MAEELDDTTAAEVGHAFVRWVIDEDPAGVARFVPTLDASAVDDSRATRIGSSIVDLLQHIDIA